MNAAASFLVNGRPSDSLNLEDRALHYGDGLFETIAVMNGEPLCWDRHLARLQHGCSILRIPAPPPALLREEAVSLCSDRCVLKIIVTRGSGGRGYSPPAAPAITRILGVYEWPETAMQYRSDGIALHVCRTRLGSQPALAGIKHLNRLEQVLARMEVEQAGAQEGLMLDCAGSVIEGAMSNVFAVRDATLLTPDLSRAGVAGIVRALILERALHWNLRAEVRGLTLDELEGADELFLTNSIIGVWPVRHIGERAFRAGPVSHDIGRALAREQCIVQTCDA